MDSYKEWKNVRVTSVKRVGKKKVFDISVDKVNEYILANGVVTHNTGPQYSANSVFVVGKRQIKEGPTIVGWQFILNIDKSRSIRERSAIPFDVTYEKGIDKYSGLLEMAKITGHVECPKMGWYTRPTVEGDKNWRRKETSNAIFWDPLLNDESFNEAVRSLYSLSGNSILADKLDAVMDEQVPDDDQPFEVDKETGEVL